MKTTTYNKFYEFGIVKAELDSGLQASHTLARILTDWEGLIISTSKMSNLDYK